MKIAILTSRYPKIGAPYNHMFVHMRSIEFVKRNIEVKVFVASRKDENYTYEGIEVLSTSSKRIVELIKEYDFLYIHLLHFYPFSRKDGWVIFKHIISSKFPFALYIHGNEVQKYTRRFYNYNYSLKQSVVWLKKDFLDIPKMEYFVRKTKDLSNVAYIFPSRWMKDEAEYNLRLKFDKFQIIPNGIDTHLFQHVGRVENKRKLVSVRSLSERVYDIQFTIDVIKLLPKQFTLDIYGQGVFIDEYNRYIKKLNLEGRVKIIPEFIERNDMNALFSNYGIFISTTKTDSQGVTMLEAMSSGLLTVSTNNSSKPEFIIDGKTGILGKTQVEIAEKINIAVKSDEIFDEITSTGRMSMLKIDISKTIDKEIEIIRKIHRAEL